MFQKDALQPRATDRGLVEKALHPPEKDEEHNEDPLTDAEVKAFADAEAAYQAEQKSLRKQSTKKRNASELSQESIKYNIIKLSINY